MSREIPDDFLWLATGLLQLAGLEEADTEEVAWVGFG